MIATAKCWGPHNPMYDTVLLPEMGPYIIPFLPHFGDLEDIRNNL
jgi:hypothetical protein